MHRAHDFAIVTLIALLVGCEARTTIEQVAVAPDSEEALPPSAEPMSGQAIAGLDLHMVSAAELAEQLASRKGKVVLLDMWATW